MIFTETELENAYLVDVEPLTDERGFFSRAWCENEFAEAGLSTRVVQCNIAFNTTMGTLRGMHYQAPPHAEVKIVRCTRGAIYDVIVDLRAESPTFRKWLGVDLTAENRRAIYIPEGFAHGYLTLTDDTETYYQVSEFYAPGAEQGVRWDDPAIAINWPGPEPTVISEKDRSWPDFAG